MKLLQLLIILFSTNVFSYSLVYIGEVKSQEWNRFGNKFYDYILSVYAGAEENGSETAVLIKIENSFGYDFYKYFYLYKCSQKQIKKNKCYENGYTINREYDDLKNILNKSIELSRSSKKTNIEKISKNIQFEGRNIRSPFGGGNARFFAQGEEKKYLILPTNFETRNASDRYYSSEEQENFLTYILRAEELINKILTKQD